MDDNDSPGPARSPRSESPMFVGGNTPSSSPESQYPDGSSRSPPGEPVLEDRYSQSASPGSFGHSPHNDDDQKDVQTSGDESDEDLSVHAGLEDANREAGNDLPGDDRPGDDHPGDNHLDGNPPGDGSPDDDDEDEDRTDSESGSSDEDDDNIRPEPKQGCDSCKALTHWLAQVVGAKHIEIRELRAKIRLLRKENRGLKRKNGRLGKENERLKAVNIELAGREAQNTARRGRNAPVIAGRQRGQPTWISVLRRARSNGGPDPDIWAQIYKTSASECNYSMHCTHPHLRLVAPYDVDVKDSAGRWPLMTPCPAPACPTFNGFDKLPDGILLKIFKELLVFPTSLIHALSRLDKFVPLTENQIPCRLLNLFYISEDISTASLTASCIPPAELLAPLAVSRKWNFLGVSVFYSMNTFALSSFGELDRFCTGIGIGRVSRLVNIEIFFMGGKMLRFDEERARRDVIDRRSMPASWLGEMNRLETVVIFIDESSKSAIRRPWEPASQKAYIRKMTAGQPNARMTRALRATRNWDALHQLRGLSYISIYDTTKFSVYLDRNRSHVRDQSAVVDLLRTGRMEKTPSRARDSRLDRLAALFPPCRQRWNPTGETFSMLQRDVYCSKFELLHNDLDRDGSPAPEEQEEEEDGENNGDSDEEGGSDKSSDSDCSTSTSSSGDEDPGDADVPILPTPSTITAYPRRRGPTPAPGFGEIFDSSAGETEEDDTASDVDEVAIRRHRTTQYVWDLQIPDHGDGIRGRPLRTRSVVSQLSHLSDDLANLFPRPQAIDLTTDDDDDCQIIPEPPAFPSKTRSVTCLGRHSSSLFVTPGPAESATASVTSKPRSSSSPRTVVSIAIDLTGDNNDDKKPNLQINKRIRDSSIESEDRKRIRLMSPSEHYN